MAREHRAEFDYLEWQYVKPFAQRWKTKIRKTKRVDDKQYEFDLFIASYLIYAALVNVIKPLDLRTKEDTAYCTNVMATFILENSQKASQLIHNLKVPTTKLCDVKKKNNFSVKSSKGLDPELESQWKQGSDEDKLLALLQSLYYLRCNLFHGNKEYADYQVALLNPANECLKIINREIHQIFTNLES